MKPPALPAAARVLQKAEAALRLIDRTVPTNLSSEYARLLQSAARGARLDPVFSYAQFPGAAELRVGLSALAQSLSGNGPVADLFAGRASELALEAALVEALGTPAFPRLAAERFRTPEGEGARRTNELVESFAAAEPKAEPLAERVASDSSDPNSLLCRIDRELGEHRSAISVVLRPELAAVAATGDGVIYVRPGVLLSPREAERIARHEVEAHALPRLAARSEIHDVFRVGTAGSSEDEEGRALLLESRAGLLGAERKRELALRHRLVLELRAGASFDDSVRRLVAEGYPLERAIGLSLRIHRGGGLGREVVYLPAFLRVSAALGAEPGLESSMKRGRISLQAARALSSTTTGA